MTATNQQGHAWTGESEFDGPVRWWFYTDEQGREYQSIEQPAYRIVMDRACMTEQGITPIAIWHKATR